ncbi:hypothetical protein MMC24_005153 [Lignoscripta atroalba]|nr:hypothetical protein [Lignoscripta atroalba]
MLLSPSPRVRTVLFGVVIIIVLSYTTFRSRHLPGGRIESSSSHSSPQATSTHANYTSSQTEFWRSFQSLLASSGPECESPKRLDRAKAVGYNAVDETPRPELLEMPNEDLERMRRAHDNFVHGIKASNAAAAIYTPSTRGIVSTAGGYYLPVLVISLRMLRRTGSNLPMEVFLASKEEYESYICGQVLPSLNAKCIVLSDILDAASQSNDTITIQHYQLKSFAMLLSSFEELLFLDADSFPIHSPDKLFESEPFISKGMLTWPDFWASSTSAQYYSISSQTQPPTTLRASSETGEILLSKKSHFQSLLLASYYNYYGPSHYYMLLSQGAPGEGDKETFLAAATALDQPFYATSEKVRPIGHAKQDGGVAGSAMVQYDPMEDYNLTKQGLWRVKNSTVADSPRPFFVHANFPKFNPVTIFDEGGPTRHPNGTYRRAWTDNEETIKGFGFDLERQFWEEIKWTACELEDKFRSWEKSHGICENVMNYWNNVFGTP